MEKINICIVDDHTLFRKAMVRLVKTFQRIDRVTDAASGEDCELLFKKSVPDVLLLDLEMPLMNGAELTQMLMNKYPDLKIIVLTMHDSENYIAQLLNMGVHSYLLKNTDPKELEKAITSVIDKGYYHNKYLTTIIKKNLIGHVRAKPPVFAAKNKLELLTKREYKILEMICVHGLTNKEIGDRLEISERTVETHRTNMMNKLKVKNAVTLVRFAYESGLIVAPQL